MTRRLLARCGTWRRARPFRWLNRQRRRLQEEGLRARAAALLKKVVRSGAAVIKARPGLKRRVVSVAHRLGWYPALCRLYGRLTSRIEHVPQLVTQSGHALNKSPFDHFHARVPAVRIVRSHEDRGRKARQGYRVNYFGVAIPDEVLPHVVRGIVPPVEVDPLPANWHADTAEFAAALRAVDLAKDTFTMIELGCGWGCWMNITGRCAKRKGLRVELIGVEGDRHHLQLAETSLAANGMAPGEYSLVHGIAHAASGMAAFPQQSPGDDHWGLAPVFSSDAIEYRAALETGKYVELPMIGLRDLTADFARVDLLHIDIQGGERALVEGCIDMFSEKVAFIVIGSHSRETEGALFETFLKAGWILEIERPALLALDETAPITSVDGVQGWRNPRLT